MQNKISSMLDAVADRLEAKGLVKEAYEIDRVADQVDASVNIPVDMGTNTALRNPESYMKRVREQVNSLKTTGKGIFPFMRPSELEWKKDMMVDHSRFIEKYPEYRPEIEEYDSLVEKLNKNRIQG